MPKIDIPLGVNGDKDLTGESKYLSTLIYKIGRTTSGIAEYTSETSGIKYSTNDYPDEEKIYNKGEIGLINIFWKLYGGKDGFLMLAEDANSYLRPAGELQEEVDLMGIDADTLGGSPPSYYLNYNNLNNLPIIPEMPEIPEYEKDKVVDFTFVTTSWVKQSNKMYQHNITISGFTFLPTHQVNLTADATNIALLNATIVPTNNNGTVYAETSKPPDSNVNVQLTIREVDIL